MNEAVRWALTMVFVVIDVAGYAWWIYEDAVRRPKAVFVTGRLTSGCPNGCRHAHGRGEKCPRRPR